jgi:predicted nucleotidyltransferase
MAAGRAALAIYNMHMRKNRTPPAYVQPYRYASPNIPRAAIKRFARKIADRFHPHKIILFGSYAYGKPHNESDVDLLVVMPASDVVNMAIRICLAFDRDFSFDLIVRTPKQIELGLRDNDWFLCEIVDKGKVLYEAKEYRYPGVRATARRMQVALRRVEAVRGEVRERLGLLF